MPGFFIAKIWRNRRSYTPLVFFLAAACQHLRAHLTLGHWRAALENVCESLRVPGLEAFGLPLGTPAFRFKSELDAAIEQAGLIDRTSLLNKENREVAIGLGVNWGIRVLLASVADYRNPVEVAGRRDFAWLALKVQAALAPCH